MNKDYQTMRPFLIPTLCAVAALAAGCDGDSSVHISSSSTSDPDAKGVLKVVETLVVGPTHRIVLIQVDDDERLVMLGEGRELIEPRKPRKGAQ